MYVCIHTHTILTIVLFPQITILHLPLTPQISNTLLMTASYFTEKIRSIQKIISTCSDHHI